MMFVIPCKFFANHNYIYELVKSIREYHKEEKIVIVDSDSEDRSYFNISKQYANIEILDVHNTHYHVGAYWIAFDAFPKEDFYYFLHDSTKIKANLDYLKNRDFTALAYFDYNNPPDENIARKEVHKLTQYRIPISGHAIYGPIFFVNNRVMSKLKSKSADKIIPSWSEHSGKRDGIAAYAIEGAYGAFFEAEGYDVSKNSMLGHICQKGIPQFVANYDSSWMYPVEKFIARRS